MFCYFLLLEVLYLMTIIYTKEFKIKCFVARLLPHLSSCTCEAVTERSFMAQVSSVIIDEMILV